MANDMGVFELTRPAFATRLALANLVVPVRDGDVRFELVFRAADGAPVLWLVSGDRRRRWLYPRGSSKRWPSCLAACSWIRCGDPGVGSDVWLDRLGQLGRWVLGRRVWGLDVWDCWASRRLHSWSSAFGVPSWCSSRFDWPAARATMAAGGWPEKSVCVLCGNVGAAACEWSGRAFGPMCWSISGCRRGSRVEKRGAAQ